MQTLKSDLKFKLKTTTYSGSKTIFYYI